jgi:hypothetical protein
MIYVSPTRSRLIGQMVVVRTYAIEGKDHFPDDMSFEEGFESIRQSLEHLRQKLSGELADQLLSMSVQAKSHFEGGGTRLGAGLMQDMEQVLRGAPPFAYPRELYRWPRTAVH